MWHYTGCNENWVRGQKLLTRFFYAAWNDRTAFLRFREIWYSMLCFYPLQAAQIKAFCPSKCPCWHSKRLRSRQPFLRAEIQTINYYVFKSVKPYHARFSHSLSRKYHHRLMAQAVYPFAPSWLPNSKDGKSRQGREAWSLSLTAFSDFATYHLSKRNLGSASIKDALR